MPWSRDAASRWSERVARGGSARSRRCTEPPLGERKKRIDMNDLEACLKYKT